MPRGTKSGVDHPRARFSKKEIREIRRMARRGWSQREIADLVTETSGRRCVHTTIGKIIRCERYAKDGAQ